MVIPGNFPSHHGIEYEIIFLNTREDICDKISVRTSFALYLSQLSTNLNISFLITAPRLRKPQAAISSTCKAMGR